VLLVNGALRLRHWQGEQRTQENPPRLPGGTAKMRGEELLVIERIENVHRGSRAVGSVIR
jgi:hypothetical protein